MATTSEIQLAQDAIRFLNVMQDLINVAAFRVKETNENDGSKFQIFSEQGGLIGWRDATLKELQDGADKMLRGAREYYLKLTGAFVKMPPNALENGLSVFGVDRAAYMQDLEEMNSVCLEALGNIYAKEDKLGLREVGVYIDQNVDPLLLIRRSWCLDGLVKI